MYKNESKGEWQNQNLIKNVNDELSETQPDVTKMEQYQINLEKIENYKTQGTIIKSKEKNYLKWRKTNKVFIHTGKKNPKKTHYMYAKWTRKPFNNKFKYSKRM